jgi:hypothetical protein
VIKMVMPRWVQLYKNETISSDSFDNKRYKIDTTNQILELDLRVRIQNGATRNAPDAAVMETPEEATTLIEVAAGSTVFKSYTGEVCRKIATYRNGRLPYTLHTQDPGATWVDGGNEHLGWMEYSFPIHFTPEGDPNGNKTNSALPAPLYKDNLNMFLTGNVTTSATAGFATGTYTFDLYAKVVPPESKDAMLNKNVIVDKKKEDYTTIASGDKEIDLTVDSAELLRRCFITCYENGIGEGVDITDVKFRVNNEVKSEFKWGQLQKINAEHKSLNYKLPLFLNTVGTTDEIWTRIPAVRPMTASVSAATAAVYASAHNVGDKVTVTCDAAAEQIYVDCYSDVIPAMVVFDFDEDGLMQNMPGGHPGNAYGDVRDMDVILVQGAADGDVDIVEQRIRKPWGL